MRVAVLWTGLSGYMNACLKELASRNGVELFVCHEAPIQQAPFEDSQFAWIKDPLVWRSKPDFSLLQERLRAFDPQIMAFSGWHVPAYRRIAKQLANRCVRVMVMDNPWEGRPKQRIGALIAPWYIRPLADKVWVPGERQAVFARKLGFREREILWGMLSCDQPAFERVHLSRLADRRPLPHSFLFVGRFVSDKGVDRLVEAYRSYRKCSIAPWPLVCCGSGPLANLLEGNPGISVEGFVQPNALREKVASAGCLILPSIFEPWAIVVHEAVSAGMLILTTERVGAAVHLVQDNHNGYIFDSGDVDDLVERMAHVSALSGTRLEAMSHASHLLSKQYSPARWADTLLDSFSNAPIG